MCIHCYPDGFQYASVCHKAIAKCFIKRRKGNKIFFNDGSHVTIFALADTKTFHTPKLKQLVYAGIRKWAELLTIHWQVCCLPLLSHCPLLLHSQEHLQRHTIRCLCLRFVKWLGKDFALDIYSIYYLYYSVCRLSYLPSLSYNKLVCNLYLINYYSCSHFL